MLQALRTVVAAAQAYAAFLTLALVLPTDLFPSRSVASVSGMSGTGAGIGTIISTYLIGYVADHYSFNPVLVAASTIPLVATALVLWLLRGTHTNRGAPFRSLEQQLQGELPVARLGDRRRNGSKSGTGGRGVRRVEAGMVHRVVNFGTELYR